MSLKKVGKFLLVFSVVSLAPSILFSDDIKDAERYYKQLDYKYALEIYEKIMRENPKMEIAERIASCYRFMNNTEAAEIWYKKTLAYPEAPATDYKFLADALKQNGKYEEAASTYRAWGEMDEKQKTVAVAKANACMVAKVWNENPDVGALVEDEIGFNSENSDFSPVIYGQDFVFASDRWDGKPERNKGKDVYGWTGNPYIKVYQYSTASQKATPFDSQINFGYHNGPIIFTKGLDTAYFTRVIMSSRANKADVGKKYIVVATKKAKGWQLVNKLPFNEKGTFSVLHPALSPNGQILYFASDMPGGVGGMDLYYATKLPDGSWSAPVNCGNVINTKEDEAFPTVRADGKLFFSSKGHIGMGGLDIFSAEGEKSSFANVENLRAPMNSSKDDFGISFNPADDQKGYLSSNRTGGVGMDDIYRFTLGIKATPKETMFAVNGLSVDKATGAPVAGLKVLLINNDSKAEKTAFSDQQGRFSFTLEPNASYTVKGDSKTYFTAQEGNFSTKGLKESTTFEIRFEVEKSDDVYTVRLNNIYYDFNKWAIRPDAVADLDKVQQLMGNMPNIKMELLAYTDARGSAAYNMALSEKRANSAKNYLISAGVNATRLSAMGKGETELLNQCTDGIKCTEAEHQLNRRTEFKIVKVPTVAKAKTIRKVSLAK